MSKFINFLKNNRLTSGIAHWFRGFSTLIAMQLKEQLSFSFKADKKGTLTKVIIFIILLIGVTAIISVVFWLLGFLNIVGNGIVPVSLFNILVYMVIILNIFSCLHKLTKSLYFSEDNQVLLTYPVNNGVIFLSKLVVYYIVELVKNFAFLVPLFLAYGITNILPTNTLLVMLGYVPWLFFSFLIISFIPVALSAVLSIPYMYVLSFFKKSQYIQSVLAFLGLATVVTFLFIGLSKMPQDLQIASKWATTYYPEVTKFADNVEKCSGPLFFVPVLVFGYFSGHNGNPHSLRIVNGNTPLVVLGFIGVIAVLVAIAYLLARPLFFKMATKPFEYQKKIINHNFKINLDKAEISPKAFIPKLSYPISKKDKIGIINKLERLLRRVNREEKVFLRQKIDNKRILRFLNKYVRGLVFEQVDVSEITDFGYIVEKRFGVPFLVLVRDIKGNTAHCYDPYFLTKKNHVKERRLTLFVKEILLDLRTPGLILSNFLLFIITPLAIALLNALFGAINTSFQGKTYTVMFNVLIIMLIVLASNVSMASIYSREGKTSYMLKAMPVNYMASLAFKLIIRSVIVIASLGLTCYLYSFYCKINFIRFDLLFFTFAFIYLGHLLWSAELDFMNPKDNLYAAIGTNVNNPNETTSAILTFVISFAMMGISFFLISTEVAYAFVKLFLIGLVFFLVRLLLFVLKIKGYGTSRAERRDN